MNCSPGDLTIFPFRDGTLTDFGPDGSRRAVRGAGLRLPGGNGIHMMFMRFPIDCVFLSRPAGDDGSRTVVAVRRALPPWRGIVWYVRGADGTLELPVGAIDRTGTAIGDRVLLETGGALH